MNSHYFQIAGWLSKPIQKTLVAYIKGINPIIC